MLSVNVDKMRHQRERVDQEWRAEPGPVPLVDVQPSLRPLVNVMRNHGRTVREAFQTITASSASRS